MLKKSVIGGLLALSFTQSALSDESVVRKNLQNKFPGAEIQSVAKTPINGLYEVVLEGQMLYADEKADYVLVGNLVEVKTQRNLTAERMRDLFKVNFDALPFDKAIKVVKGNGKRRIAVFSDPDCPFCRKLEKDLEGVDNVTIYTFLYPIEGLHPDATAKAKAIWCAPDRAKAWSDMMLRNTLPKNNGKCKNPVDEIVALGQKLRISGTPTIIFSDGRVVPGAVPPEQLEKLMDAAGKSS